MDQQPAIGKKRQIDPRRVVKLAAQKVRPLTHRPCLLQSPGGGGQIHGPRSSKLHLHRLLPAQTRHHFILIRR